MILYLNLKEKLGMCLKFKAKKSNKTNFVIILSPKI